METNPTVKGRRGMKYRLITIALLLSAAAGLLAGCGEELGHTDLPNSGEDWPVRITAVLPHADQGYWTDVGNAVTEQAQQLGTDAKVVTPQLNYNVPQMVELIRQAIATQIDALIVQGIDDAGYRAALSDAVAQGILVVLVDTDLPDDFDHLYVGTDNYAAGVQMGEQLIEISGGQAVVAVLSGAPGYPNLDERVAGLRDAVAGCPGIEIRRVEYNEYDSLTALEKYNLILQEDPDVDTLVCVEGTGGQTVGQMISPENCPLEQILVFDLSEETLQGVENGLIDGVLLQQQSEMGRIAVEEIMRCLEQGSYSGTVHYTPTAFYTAQQLKEGAADENR